MFNFQLAYDVLTALDEFTCFALINCFAPTG